jgi:tetratricopeptide (TPR) repeat protein
MARLFLLLTLLVLPGLAAAQNASADDPPVAGTDISSFSEDQLFAKLAAMDEPSPQAKRLEAEILRRFHHSGSETADLLFARALEAMNAQEHALSLDLLDEVILIRPDFAEAWNKRATVYFLQRDYGNSLADIRKTLALEPRHFGALAGLGMILESLGRDEEALRALNRALDLNPQLESVRESADSLEKKMSGRAI